MIIEAGDCIPVRTHPRQWAPYYGRVVGFDPIENILIVVNRDAKKYSAIAKKKVKYVIESLNGRDFTYWLEVSTCL